MNVNDFFFRFFSSFLPSMYADDITLLISKISYTNFMNVGNNELIFFYDWSASKGFSINVYKSFTFFVSK